MKTFDMWWCDHSRQMHLRSINKAMKGGRVGEKVYFQSVTHLPLPPISGVSKLTLNVWELPQYANLIISVKEILKNIESGGSESPFRSNAESKPSVAWWEYRAQWHLTRCFTFSTKKQLHKAHYCFKTSKPYRSDPLGGRNCENSRQFHF